MKRLFARIGAATRRLIDRQIIESDLAVGNYEVVVAERGGQYIKDHEVFNCRSEVQKGLNSWIVLSKKPLPIRFSVVRDGIINKVVG